MESIFFILVCVSGLHFFHPSWNGVNGQGQDNITTHLSSPSTASVILESIESEQKYPRPILVNIRIEKMPKWLEDNVIEGVYKWYKNTCFRFRFSGPDTSEKYDFSFEYNPRRECSKHEGVANGYYPIILNDGCNSVRFVTHRFGHMFRVYDEQRRPDRDEYLEILSKEDMPSNAADNVLDILNEDDKRRYKWQTDTWSSYANTYDVFSIMNLPPRSFDEDTKTRYRTKNYKLRGLLGRFGHPSTRDLYRLNMSRGCIGFLRRLCKVEKDPCRYGGFTGGHCKCVCTEDRTGPLCENLIENSYVTGDVGCNYRLTQNESVIASYDFTNYTVAESWCSIEIEAPEDHYIIMRLVVSEPLWTPGYESKRCKGAYMSIIEIEKETDKELVLCGKDLDEFTFYKSETNKVDILYDNRTPDIFRGFHGNVTFHKNPATTTVEPTTSTTEKPTTTAQKLTTTTKKLTTTTTTHKSTSKITTKKPTIITTTTQKPLTSTTTHKPTTTNKTPKPTHTTLKPSTTTTTEKPTTSKQKPKTTTAITTQKPTTTTETQKPTTTTQKPKTTTATQKPTTTSSKPMTTAQKPITASEITIEKALSGNEATTATNLSSETTPMTDNISGSPKPPSIVKDGLQSVTNTVTAIASGSGGAANHGSDNAFEPIWLLGYLSILFIADLLLHE